MAKDVTLEEVTAGADSAARPRESAMLVLQRGAESGRRWPLDRNAVLTIGRNDD